MSTVVQVIMYLSGFENTLKRFAMHFTGRKLIFDAYKPFPVMQFNLLNVNKLQQITLVLMRLGCSMPHYSHFSLFILCHPRCHHVMCAPDERCS